ncbi:MAG: thiamine-phosphate synthase family protein [Thermofilum sp.]
MLLGSLEATLFIPFFRRLVIRELRNLGESQVEIARALGITQAAVSKVLRSGRMGSNSKPPPPPGGLEVSAQELHLVAKKVAKLIQAGELNEAGFLANRYWLLLAASGDACRAHEKLGWRRSECHICTKMVYPELDISRGLVLADIERALIILSASDSFPELIPEVLTNIAVAIPGARNLYDIAAIPGRISKTRSGELLYRKPEFGASKHLGGILLSIEGKYRAVMNIKYNRAVREAMLALGVVFREFSSVEYPSSNPAALAARQLFNECPACTALVDSGGEHVEPVVYLFGNKAVEVANLAVNLSEVYYAVSRKLGGKLEEGVRLAARFP